MDPPATVSVESKPEKPPEKSDESKPNPKPGRGATVVPAGESYGQWKGLNEVVKDKEVVWPPMVVIMNTLLEQDENDKWLGMGNQELLDYFGSYEAVGARHSYGPKGHRGMSVLIFESSAVGYTEAERLSKSFEHQGTDRDAWDHHRILFYPGGKRQLYGYLATKRDLDFFNQHCQGKSKLKFELVSYQEKVVNQLKQMNEDNQQLNWYKNKIVKDQRHSRALEESFGFVSQRLKKTEEENRIVRERTQWYHEQNKEEMDYQEQFFKDQLKVIQDARTAKEGYFDRQQKEERMRVEQAYSVADPEKRRGATVVPAGESYGQWKGLNEVVKDKEVVWPPMVVIMNTLLEQDENDKWLGMGNQELLDYFGSYEAVGARHSYGPKGHRGMSVLIFESSAVGYTEAERLSKSFEHQGTDRDAWDHHRILFYPGGKRQLYGYLATKRDLDFFNQHCQGKSKLKFELVSYQEKVVNQLKQMNEDNQQLNWYKNKIVEDQRHSRALEESFGFVSQRLKKTEEENRIVRERTQWYHEQNKEEMDYQEQFFKDQLKVIQDARTAKEGYFDRQQKEERMRVEQAYSVADPEKRRGATVVPAGESYGQWKGLNEVVKDKEVVWPPMVVIMNTLLEQDENDKWLGMGNQELLDYFGSYEAVGARHSYGPKGHRGMSVLIFESSAVGYTEAERLSKSFEHQGTDRDAWDHHRILFYPGGKRQLYGYLATKRDLDFFNQHCQGKSKLKFELVSYQEKVVNQLKQMNEDNQQLNWYKNKIVEDQRHSRALEESFGFVSQRLKKTEEENRIVRERTQWYHEQNKEEMDYQEQFFKDQLKVIQDARTAKEGYFDRQQKEERMRVEQAYSVADPEKRDEKLEKMNEFEERREQMMKRARREEG